MSKQKSNIYRSTKHFMYVTKHPEREDGKLNSLETLRDAANVLEGICPEIRKKMGSGMFPDNVIDDLMIVAVFLKNEADKEIADAGHNLGN